MTLTLDRDTDTDDVLATSPRSIDAADRRRFEGYVSEILTALGMDLNTPGTAETPRRYLQALFDATDGYEGDPKLLTAFPTECYGDASCELAQIVEGPIPFFSLCEHHALPFHGQAYVGYVAHDQIIGISKLTRLVRVFTRRFGVQERMTHQIAVALGELLGAHGVAVYHRGRSHVHADAWRTRGQRQDAHDRLPRRVRARPGPALRVLPHVPASARAAADEHRRAASVALRSAHPGGPAGWATRAAD